MYKSPSLSSLFSLFTAGLGFVTSFLASYFLSKESFAWITLSTSQVFLATAFCSLGLLGYFLGRLEKYSSNESSLVVFPLSLAVIVSFLAGFALNSDAVILAFWLIASVLANSLLVRAQVKKRQLNIAVYQAIPSLIRSISIAFVLVYYMLLRSDFKYYNSSLLKSAVLFVSLVFCVILIFAIISLLRRSEQRSIGVALFKDRDLYAAWFNVVAAFAFTMAIPSIVVLKFGLDGVAYFGVYMIFWAISSTLTNIFIANSFSFRIAHAFVEQDASVLSGLISSMKKRAVLISVFMFVFVSLVSMFSGKVWGDLPYIQNYLLQSSILLFLKCLQSAYSLLLLRPHLTTKRAGILTLTFSLFLLSVALVDGTRVTDVISILILAEGVGLLLMAFFSKSESRTK